MKEEKKATWLGIIGNILLFVSKLIVGIAYNSIAIISDALNSFTDIIASFIVHLSVIISYGEPDKEHQFGHDRAQPIAALIVAIFIGIVGFEIIAASITRILEGQRLEPGLFPVFLIAIVMIAKFVMYLYTNMIYKRTNSIALKASTIDHRNDVLISFAVLLSIIISNFGYPIFDPLVGIVIGVWIIISGYNPNSDDYSY